MKHLILIPLAFLLAGCPTAHIQITTTDPATNITTDCTVDSMRRVAITCGNATVISGQVLINDETVQVLGREAAAAASPLSKGPGNLTKDQP